MSTNKSAKLSKKLGLHLEDAVDVFELLKKEMDTTNSSSSKATNTEAKLSDKLGLHLEDAVDVFQLLKKELDTTNSSSSKATNTDMFELNSQRADLKARELELQADRAEFKAKQQEWEATKGGVSSERELKAAKAKLKEDMLQLEAEKTQFRVAQIQLKAAQSQLEDAKRNLESAQTQLEEARGELETARKHLEAAKTQTDITNTRLAAAKQSLDAAKMRFEGATKQLNDAKSKFEDATTQLEAATSATTSAGVGMCMSLEEENIKLRIQVDQLRSEISNGQKTNEAELKKSKVENERLATDNSKLKNEKLRVEDELKESVANLEQVKNEIKSLQADKNKIVEEDPSRVKFGNPKVFFDITIRGLSAGRIIFELFTDIIPDYVELFRAICTGEKRVSQKGKPLHYKGTSITYFHKDYILGGNFGTMTSDEAQSIYGDLKPVGKEFIKESITLGNLFMFLKPDRRRDCSVGIFISMKQNPAEYTFAPNVVIGKVIQGIEVLHAIKIAFSNGPSRHLDMNEMVIANSGQLS
ncbi:unnamed protein product [Rhodiola kirilowii]